MKYDVPQRPLKPSLDLRDMLRSHIIRRSLDYMEKAAKRRQDAIKTRDIQSYKNTIVDAVARFYGKLPVGPNAAPVKPQLVSSFERDGYRVENVLFESFPGYQVNASVYIPTDDKGPWPGVVVPVGHSGKQFYDYQIPAQFFARSGYVVALFDPPGQSGEKKEGNDHFIDGVRCYLLGETSSKYFIGDALRCVDYLAQRDDVDSANGLAMTGVSGGGTTTTLAGLIDDRLVVLGPSCCLTPLADLDITQCYCGCPETHMWARYRYGIDEVDLLCAATGKAMLLMAGEHDSVFRINDTRRLAQQVQEFYQNALAANCFDFYVDPDPRGHCYSLNQARQFTAFMNTHLRRDPNAAICQLPDEAFVLDDPEQLRCHPQTNVNMRSLALDRALELQSSRDTSLDAIRAAAQSWVGCDKITKLPPAQNSAPFLLWTHTWENVLLQVAPDIELPGTLLLPVRNPSGAILHFDDAGHNRLLEANGILAQAAGSLNKTNPHHALFSLDLRGWGDTETAMYPYEIAAWGSRDRYLSYAAAALGDSLMAMRVRDGLAALCYLRSRDEVDPENIVVTGCGNAALVALHVALLDQAVAGVITWDGLFSFRQLLEHADYSWPADAFVPGILQHYDLPDLAAALHCNVAVLQPRDGRGQPIKAETLAQLNEALTRKIYRTEVDLSPLINHLMR
ncbi:MAG: acetylxylan esterase [Sedimentisphaerales bacterium]|nr:acetylxylan esterase [Sedimentisphaerales bacterium]